MQYLQLVVQNQSFSESLAQRMRGVAFAERITPNITREEELNACLKFLTADKQHVALVARFGAHHPAAIRIGKVASDLKKIVLNYTRGVK